ncbi:MAG TPA: DUF58 domain-containing protein [Aggregatilineales bacterium]|nr:DUF58 domain-containing protein [Aggregatilineales bacterium]
MPERLFDEKTLRKLERLSLIASRVRAGVMKGERRSNKRGTSIEFADYRNYTRGDDLRRVDWNVYARLDRPFVKLLEEEEDLSVHLLIDASGSMDWPRDGETVYHKFTFAQRVLAGLGYISLGSGDQLTATALGETNATWGPSRGRGHALGLLDFIAGLSCGGQTDLNGALRAYAVRTTRPGLCLLISDLMSPTGYQEGLSALQGRGYEVGVIHVLSHDEVMPELAGDLHLVDVESGQGQDVTVDVSMRDLYQRRLLAWRDEIGTFCTRRGIHYATVETGNPWEELILYELRRLGVVR